MFGGLIAWREAIKAAMFLTTDNATAQAKLLLVRTGACALNHPARMHLWRWTTTIRLLPDYLYLLDRISWKIKKYC